VHSSQTLAGAAATTTSSAAAGVTATTTAATSPTTAAVTTAPVQQGPVGQPGSTPENAGDPTPFVYTTTDANGDYIPVTATFTPSFPSTTPYTPTGSGTVLQYSAYLSMASSGGAGATQGANSASRPGVDIGLLLGGISTAFMGVLGWWLVVLM
jgi:hypothetical protein